MDCLQNPPNSCPRARAKRTKKPTGNTGNGIAAIGQKIQRGRHVQTAEKEAVFRLIRKDIGLVRETLKAFKKYEKVAST